MAMPLGNGGGAIAITDTSDPALPSCASGNGVSVRVIADAVGLKIRGVPGVPQHWTEGLRDANGPSAHPPVHIHYGLKQPCHRLSMSLVCPAPSREVPKQLYESGCSPASDSWCPALLLQLENLLPLLYQDQPWNLQLAQGIHSFLQSISRIISSPHFHGHNMPV